MTSIGASPGIGSGPQFAITPASPASAPAAPATPADPAATPSPVGTAGAVAGTLGTGGAAIDQDRVTMIRKAIQSGNYPVIPTKIGDAMIAAGVLLRTT